MKSFEDKIKHTITANNLFDYDDDIIKNPILLMVSGGCDSVAIFRMLVDKNLGTAENVKVLHVNHNMRDNSLDDEEFVKNLCILYNVPCEVYSFDINKYAVAYKLNLEDAGRIVRYQKAQDILTEYCSSLGYDYSFGRIISGHNMDENIETVLMRIFSGTGMAGLSGIPVKRDNIIRPLLFASKNEIKEYLKSINQEWKEDETNLDTEHYRAWVRHEIMPVIEEKNPKFKEKIFSMSEIMSSENDYLDDIVKNKIDDIKYIKEDNICLNGNILRKEHIAIQRRIFRKVIMDCDSSLRIESDMVDDLVNHLNTKYRKDISGNIHVVIDNDIVFLKNNNIVKEENIWNGNLGKVLIGSNKFDISLVEKVDNLFQNKNQCVIPCSYISGKKVVIRSIKNGDRFIPFGSKSEKKVKRFLIDEKVPFYLRDKVQVLTVDNEILWVIGYRKSEKLRLNNTLGFFYTFELINQ